MAIKRTILLLGSILVSIQYTHQEVIPESTETNGTAIASSTMVPETSPSSTATVMTTNLSTTVATILPTNVTISIPTTLTAITSGPLTTAPKDEDAMTKPTEATTQTNAQTSLVTATTDSQTSLKSETVSATTVLPINQSSPAPSSPTITVPLPSSVSPTVTPIQTISTMLVPATVPDATSNAPSTSHTTQQSTEDLKSSAPETSVPTSNATQTLPAETSSITSNPVTSLPTSTTSLDRSSSTTATKQVVDSKLKEICQTLKEMMKTEHCSFTTKKDDKQHILTFKLDDGELTTSTMAPPPSSKRPTQTEEKNEEVNRDTLISILASCGALVLILCCFAGYCTYHRRSYRKNQQHLTEELQTVENGYHDNPTLEVMEVQPEMQEKKMALNREFNDSWIVPIDNLLKDDMPDEEDTHL